MNQASQLQFPVLPLLTTEKSSLYQEYKAHGFTGASDPLPSFSSDFSLSTGSLPIAHKWVRVFPIKKQTNKQNHSLNASSPCGLFVSFLPITVFFKKSLFSLRAFPPFPFLVPVLLLIASTLPCQVLRLHLPKEKILAGMINGFLIVNSHECLACLAGDIVVHVLFHENPVLPWLLDYCSPLLALLSVSTLKEWNLS